MNKSNTARATSEEKEPFWRRELAGWHRSGLSQVEYQRKHGLTKNAFTYWKRKLQGCRARATFVAVPRQLVRAAAQPGGSAGIRLRVAGGYVVEVASEFEAESLERLLRVLEHRAR